MCRPGCLAWSSHSERLPGVLTTRPLQGAGVNGLPMPQAVAQHHAAVSGLTRLAGPGVPMLCQDGCVSGSHCALCVVFLQFPLRSS